MGENLPLAPAKKPFTWISESDVSITSYGFSRKDLVNNTNKNWTSSTYVRYKIGNSLYITARQSFNGYLELNVPNNLYLTYLRVYSKQNSNIAYQSYLTLYSPEGNEYVQAENGDYGWVEWTNNDGKFTTSLRLYAARSHTGIGGAGNTTCEISEMRGYMLVGGNQ